MKNFAFDCHEILNEHSFWTAYLEATCPESAANFGFNRAAFRDAVLGGGPGWPGECVVTLVNADRLRKIDSGQFHRFLEGVAVESSFVRIRFE